MLIKLQVIRLWINVLYLFDILRNYLILTFLYLILIFFITDKI